MVWSNPDTRKCNHQVPVHTSYSSATLPGRWKFQKNEARVIVCKWSYKSLLGTQGPGFKSQEDASAFHIFNLMIMTVQCSVPIMKPVACNLYMMWQILHDQALKTVADF